MGHPGGMARVTLCMKLVTDTTLSSCPLSSLLVIFPFQYIVLKQKYIKVDL